MGFMRQQQYLRHLIRDKKQNLNGYVAMKHLLLDLKVVVKEVNMDFFAMKMNLWTGKESIKDEIKLSKQHLENGKMFVATMKNTIKNGSLY